MTHNCYRCGEEHRTTDTMRYVRGEDTVEQVEREVLVAVKHTERTRRLRDRLVEHHDALDKAGATVALGRGDRTWLSDVDEDGNQTLDIDIDPAAFDRETVAEPRGPESDPDIVRTETETRTVEEQRTGLICKSCGKESDEVIW